MCLPASLLVACGALLHGAPRASHSATFLFNHLKEYVCTGPYCIAGLGFVISRSILFFNLIKFLGAAYLIYLGAKSFFSKSERIVIDGQEKHADISRAAAFKIGFLTNVLNPKATIFFLSLFTLVISPQTAAPVLAVVSGIMIVSTGLWFSLVAIFFTQQKIRGVFSHFQNIFQKTFGGLLVALGIKLAATTQK